MSVFAIVKPRICELGKIKIGGKSPQVRQSAGGGTWRAPMKYDHFVVTTLHRNDTDDLIPDTVLMDSLKAQYGDKDGHLRQLPIAVLSDDIEDIIQASYVWYVGKKIAGRSDGKTLTKFFDANKGEWLKAPVEVPWKPEFADLVDKKGVRLFKQHATFNCVIAAKQAHWGGVYKFRTTSTITASQLLGSMLEIQQLTGGVLRGMPMRLAIRPMQVSPNGTITTIYVVHCELVGEDLIQIQQMAVDRAKHRLACAQQTNAALLEYRKLLHAPGENESPVEEADAAEEFHPEAIRTDTPQLMPPTKDDGEIIEPLHDEQPMDPDIRDTIDDYANQIANAERGHPWGDFGAEIAGKENIIGKPAVENLLAALRERRAQVDQSTKSGRPSKADMHKDIVAKAAAGAAAQPA